MPAQLRFAQETIDAALVEPGGVQSHLDAITLDPEKLYALVNTSGLRAYSFSEELYSLFGCVHIKVHCPKVSGWKKMMHERRMEMNWREVMMVAKRSAPYSRMV